MSLDGGSLDILGLKPLEPVEVVKKVIKLDGYIYDLKTQEPLQATVELTLPGEKCNFIDSDEEDGYYAHEFALVGNYEVKVSKEGYLNYIDSLEVYESESDQYISKNIYLKPLEVGTAVRLNNIFFDFDKAILRPESFPELDLVVGAFKKE